MMFNLMVVSYRIFSLLDHILIDYVLGAAIPIVHSDRDCGDEDGHGGLCRAAKSGGYCAAKTTPPHENILREYFHALFMHRKR